MPTNPDWFKYITPGDVIVLMVIVALVIGYFKWWLPKQEAVCKEDKKIINAKIDLKTDIADCGTLRSLCNEKLLERLTHIETKFDLKVSSVTEKLLGIEKKQDEHSWMIGKDISEIKSDVRHITDLMINGGNVKRREIEKP